MSAMTNDPHFAYLAAAYGFTAAVLAWMIADTLFSWRRAQQLEAQDVLESAGRDA